MDFGEKRVLDSVGHVKRARLNFVGCETGFVEVSSSQRRKIVWHYFKNQENVVSYDQFLRQLKPIVIQKLAVLVYECLIKFSLKLESTYSIPNDKNSSENRTFKRSARVVFSGFEVGNIIDKTFSKIVLEQDTYTSKGSEFTSSYIDGMLLGVYRYSLMDGSSFILLPADIAASWGSLTHKIQPNFV